MKLCEVDDLAKRIQSSFDFRDLVGTAAQSVRLSAGLRRNPRCELAGYNFWGHCDLDLIFGLIRDHLAARCCQADQILFNGNFSLYRNTAESAGQYPHEVGEVGYRDAITNAAAMHFDQTVTQRVRQPGLVLVVAPAVGRHEAAVGG